MPRFLPLLFLAFLVLCAVTGLWHELRYVLRSQELTAGRVVANIVTNTRGQTVPVFSLNPPSGTGEVRGAYSVNPTRAPRLGAVISLRCTRDTPPRCRPPGFTHQGLPLLLTLGLGTLCLCAFRATLHWLAPNLPDAVS